MLYNLIRIFNSNYNYIKAGLFYRQYYKRQVYIIENWCTSGQIYYGLAIFVFICQEVFIYCGLQFIISIVIYIDFLQRVRQQILMLSFQCKSIWNGGLSKQCFIWETVHSKAYFIKWCRCGIWLLQGFNRQTTKYLSSLRGSP